MISLLSDWIKLWISRVKNLKIGRLNLNSHFLIDNQITPVCLPSGDHVVENDVIYAPSWDQTSNRDVLTLNILHQMTEEKCEDIFEEEYTGSQVKNSI